MVSLVWLGLTALASSTIVVAAGVVQQRAFLQSSADAVALAVARHDINEAQRFADHIGVTIVATDYENNRVTVTVRNQFGSSSASALR